MLNDETSANICGVTLNVAKHPLKNPFILTSLSVLFGVIIGTLVAALGIHKINFILLSSLLVGMIYAVEFKKTMPRRTRYKCALCYLLLMYVITSIIYITNPLLLDAFVYHLRLFFFVILPVEAIFFSLLLWFGGFLQLKFADKEVLAN